MKSVHPFVATSYGVDLIESTDYIECQCTIEGNKMKPSHRITLHVAGLKTLDASLERITKGKREHIPISRINHHRSFGEIRLHTDIMLYPGHYVLHVTTRSPRNEQTILAIKNAEQEFTKSAASALPYVYVENDTRVSINKKSAS